MVHIDLFSGIGGFAYALDQVFYEETIQHVFVENDPFCQAILKKHWPGAEMHGDIRKYKLPSLQTNDTIETWLKRIGNTEKLCQCTSKECLCKILRISSKLPDKQCGKFLKDEDVILEITSGTGKKTIFIVGQRQKNEYIDLSSELLKEGLSSKKHIVKYVVRQENLKTVEARFKHTIPTIQSRCKSCGCVSNVIINGIKQIKQSYETVSNAKGVGTHYRGEACVLTGGFP